jgi:hypothetical protein
VLQRWCRSEMPNGCRYRLVVFGLFLCFPGPRLLFVVNPFGCKRLFVPHINKRSNGTFLLDRIMINIPLGTNITIKESLPIAIHLYVCPSSSLVGL